MSDFGLFLLLCAGLLVALGVIRFLAWLTELQDAHGSLGRAGVNTVKKYVAPRPRVMSRYDEGVGPYVPLLIETDSRRQTDRQAAPPPSRAVMLDSHRLLRKYGIPREEARQMYKSLGLPLDNNLWTDAAPPDDPHITPVAGRPTDADFPYQPIA